MKPFTTLRFLAVLAFLCGTPVFAQQSATPGNLTRLLQGTPAQSTLLQLTKQSPGASCPVSLRARHKADGTMVQTGAQTHEAHPKGLGQWLHLTLANPQGKKVITAWITVQGFSNRARVTQTSGNGSDASQTLSVRFTAVDQAAETDVWVPDMTAVQTIDLNSVTFGDGSVWSFAGNAGCRITPDPLMLIAGR
jgi:hypothetical protein